MNAFNWDGYNVGDTHFREDVLCFFLESGLHLLSHFEIVDCFVLSNTQGGSI